MLWIILSLLGAAGAAPHLVARQWQHWLCLVPAAGLLWLLFGVDTGAVVQYAWLSSLGAELSFVADALGKTMTTLILGIGCCIILYANTYLKDDPQRGRFLFILFSFMASMVGVVLADNLILFFVFWELTSVTSYLLIGYKHEDKKARGHALQALLVTGFGGVAMLVGLLLLADATGTWRLSEMYALAGTVKDSPNYLAILSLIVLGAFTKSAQFPFHFWLPNAMSAPTPVSAFLHSATMVKAGVFLLAKMDPLIGGTPEWQNTLLFFGSVTFLLGGLAGLFQTDLKRVLAYTTIAVLGALTALLGLPGEKARTAFILLLIAHALYKATLFMIVGALDHSTHTRDWRKLGHLSKFLPLTAVVAVVAASSKIGLPPLIGFLAKEKGYMASIATGDLSSIVVTSAFLVGNMIMVALAIRVGWAPFWAQAIGDEAKVSSRPTLGLTLGPILLAGIGIILGSATVLTEKIILSPVLGAWLEAGHTYPLKLWHGWNLPLALSILTVIGGIGLFLLTRTQRWVHSTDFSFQDPVERIYDYGLVQLLHFSGVITNRIQSGDLRQYIAIILASVISLVSIEFWRKGFWPSGSLELTPLEPIPVVAALLIIVGAVGAVLAHGRFIVLTWLSISGFATAWLFLYYSGPDLALTLLSVETITVLLLALSVRRVPDPILHTSLWVRVLRGIFSVAGGVMIALLLFKAKAIQLGAGIGQTMTERSSPDGKGFNVVNVILVDFRALDTLGEITVLVIAALGVLSLIYVASAKNLQTNAK